MADTPHPLSPDNLETPHMLSSVDDIVTRLRDHSHTLVSDCECIRCEAAAEVVL